MPSRSVTLAAAMTPITSFDAEREVIHVISPATNANDTWVTDQGTLPLFIVPPGAHLVILRKDGYHTELAWYALNAGAETVYVGEHK